MYEDRQIIVHIFSSNIVMSQVQPSLNYKFNESKQAT